ncbi:CocE/NonD family hydrolase, partial [Myxococcota bacterium]|nr:CocE/NonD family hydrolase [Myxococcota bacterium]
NVELWVQDFRVVFARVPIQSAAFVRGGYEYLNVEKTTDPLLSKPLHSVEKQTIMVPMRDKVELSTDIYRPKGLKQKLPLILIRTPYKKELNELDANYFATRGYAVAVQDVRGRFASKGTWVPFMNEGLDGRDAIEWLAKQPWCDGKVGMIGASYVGWVQLWAAAERPKHLVTIIPNVAPPGPFYNIPYEYGVFFIFGSIWWAEILETNATGDISGSRMNKINDRRYEKELLSLPVIDLDKKILGKENPYWRAWIKNNVNGPYWARANLGERLKNVSIPVFLQSGWFDGDGIGSKLNYEALKSGGNKNLKLILGPWGHSDKSSRRRGETDFGKEATPDLQVLYLRWFDHWLKGVPNKIMDEPRVQLFTMSSNKWATGKDYPLPGTQFTKLFISSTKGAQSAKGDGVLAFEAPTGGSPFDQYIYDPADPTPALDFYFKDAEQLRKERDGKAVDIKKLKEKQKMNHRIVSEKRKDVLVYETPPLKEPLTIAGPLSAQLYASSSAKDTDWFVSLSVVKANGEILQLGRGKIRARFRTSMFKPTTLEKDKVYQYSIDMWQTGITFGKGEKLRVEIASAAFPFFSRNLNTGGHNEMETAFKKATQRIHHSAKYPTHILLPVIK